MLRPGSGVYVPRSTVCGRCPLRLSGPLFYRAPAVLSDAVTEDSARDAALDLARENGLGLRGSMIDGDRNPQPHWPSLYNPPAGFPSGWWVVKALPEPWNGLLQSSTLIGVSKWTGGARVLGSAGDEG